MGLATVFTDIAPLFERPAQDSTRADEALYGMSVQVMQELEAGWCYVRTEHATEGYMPAACLDKDAEVAAAWRKYKKAVVLAPYIDVQAAASPAAPRMASMPRGGIVVPLNNPSPDGWQKVGLTSGGVGYTRASYLGEVITDWSQLDEGDMRWNIVETALSYNGTAYRAGGRSPMGIDGVGLAAMAYQMNGVTIHREPFIKPGGPLHGIDFKKMDEGDVLFFHEGVGVYMGDHRFVHATTYAGSEGVVVSSLRAKDADYRPDLAGHIVAVGSLF